MAHFVRYLLDPNRLMSHLRENLEGTNALSTAVFKNIELKKGEFYTLFNTEIKEEQLYGFKWGGVGGSTKFKISYIVQEQLQNYQGLNCIFDDTGATYIENYKDPLFLETGVYYEDEVYYLVSEKNVSKKLLDTCFYASESTWHSFCILTKYHLPVRNERFITHDEIILAAEMAHFVIIGAYDGESYILWKKT